MRNDKRFQDKRVNQSIYKNWTAGTGFVSDIINQHLKESEGNKVNEEPEKMTMDRAIQDLRIMATGIVVDNDDYVKRLNAIADFLESITWVERES